MDKLKRFMKKHWIMTIVFGGIGGILLLKVVAFFGKMFITFIVKKSKNAICYIASQQFADKLIEYSHISTFKFANAICGYLEICIGVGLTFSLRE